MGKPQPTLPQPSNSICPDLPCAHKTTGKLTEYYCPPTHSPSAAGGGGVKKEKVMAAPSLAKLPM